VDGLKSYSRSFDTRGPTRPTPPTNVAEVASRNTGGSVALTWTLPEDDGGTDIIAYEVWGREVEKYTVEGKRGVLPFKYRGAEYFTLMATRCGVHGHSTLTEHLALGMCKSV
jgi:hypothetical protein